MTKEEKAKKDEAKVFADKALREKRMASFGQLRHKGPRRPGVCDCDEASPAEMTNVNDIDGQYCQRCYGVLNWSISRGRELRAPEGEPEVDNQTYIPLVADFLCIDVTRLEGTRDAMVLWLNTADGRNQFTLNVISTEQKVTAAVNGATIRGKRVSIEFQRYNQSGIPINPRILAVLKD